MIIEIVGKTGAGKTALNTLFMLRELQYNGLTMQRHSAQIITELNRRRKRKLMLPTKAPFYVNYEACLPMGYKQEFKPYWVNPYCLGVSTPQLKNKLQFLLPCSCVHITEGRKYWDGRESSTMPDNVSQWFETHRHNCLTIIIDAQRGKALDLNIRENAHKFIEVQGMYNEKDAYNRTIRSTWYCREFYSLQDYEAYLVNKMGFNCRETMYWFNGNIFEYYDSQNRKEDFVPPEGREYSMLELVDSSELEGLNREAAEIYNAMRPSWYRKKQQAAA